MWQFSSYIFLHWSMKLMSSKIISATARILFRLTYAARFQASYIKHALEVFYASCKEKKN